MKTYLLLLLAILALIGCFADQELSKEQALKPDRLLLYWEEELYSMKVPANSTLVFIDSSGNQIVRKGERI